MEITTEEIKTKKNLLIYVVIGILIVAIVAIYFVFFSPAQKQGIWGKFSGAVQDFSLVPDSLKKDVTGGIVNFKFTPNDILENSAYKSFRSYADAVEIKFTPGRPNPFISF